MRSACALALCLAVAGTATLAGSQAKTVAVPATARHDAATPATPAPAGVPAARCLYIPPGWADRVVYYHSFDTAVDRPEINTLGAKVLVGDAAGAPGLAGRGCRFEPDRKNKRGLGLTGLALPLHRPWTLSMWWRLEAPMKAESGFGLISMHGKGFMSNFVAGKGPWCALREPTFVAQVYNWPGVSNINDIYEGPAWVEPAVWRHAAMVVSKGSQVRILWDGAPKADLALKGRLLTPADAAGSIEIGPGGSALPITIDEVMVLDVALEAGAIRDYMTAVRHLAAAGVPVLSAM
jgi:hypothetical protein